MQSDTYHGESTWNRVALGPIGGSSNPNLSSQARLFKSWVSYPFREAVEKLLHFSTQVTMSKSLRLHKHITWYSLNLCFGSNYYYFLLWLRKRIKSDNIHESTEPSHVLRQGSIWFSYSLYLPLPPASCEELDHRVVSSGGFSAVISVTCLLPSCFQFTRGFSFWCWSGPSRGWQEVSPVLPVTPREGKRLASEQVVTAEGRWEINKWSTVGRAEQNTGGRVGGRQPSPVQSLRDGFRDWEEGTEAWMLVSGEDKQKVKSSSSISQVYSASMHLASSTLFQLLVRP